MLQFSRCKFVNFYDQVVGKEALIRDMIKSELQSIIGSAPGRDEKVQTILGSSHCVRNVFWYVQIFLITSCYKTGHWGQTSPHFQNSSKNYFTTIPIDYGLGTENPRNLDVEAIFAIFRILIFFQITSFSACGIVDKI